MTATKWKLSALGVAVLLVAAGCSDDNGDDATDGSDDVEAIDDVVDRGADVDPCSLLEVSEIEAEFGGEGTVLEGRESFDQCSWEVGEDQSQPGTGSVHVFVQFVDPSLPIGGAEGIFADQEAAQSETVAVDGIGDEAYFEPNGPSVNVRSGDLIWFVQATFIPEVDGTQEKLEVLAGHVADRV